MVTADLYIMPLFVFFQCGKLLQMLGKSEFTELCTVRTAENMLANYVFIVADIENCYNKDMKK